MFFFFIRAMICYLVGLMSREEHNEKKYRWFPCCSLIDISLHTSLLGEILRY